MRKLILTLDDLRVETFEPVPGAPRGRGTVRAHQPCQPGDTTICDSRNVCGESQCPTCGMVIQPFRAADQQGGASRVGNCCV